MTLLHYFSYVGIVAAFAFVTLSLASGLLWIAELIEEHSRLAKTVGVRAVYVIIAAHVALYLFDSLPFTHLLFSIACHLTYLQNFSSTWPFISLSSLSFIASCVLAVVNHFIWFFYFSRRAHEARHTAHRVYRGPQADAWKPAPGFADVATFFALCIWFIPLFLFLSLSANDNALPMDSGLRGVTPTGTPPSAGSYEPVTTSRSSLFKSIVDLFPRIRRKNRLAEGIIAPSSPLPPSMPATPTPSSGPYAQVYGYPNSPAGAPPMSPALSGQSRTLDETQGRTRVHLRPPPKRAVTGPIPRQKSGEGEWIDLSETVSASASSSGNLSSSVKSRSPSRRLHAD